MTTEPDKDAVIRRIEDLLTDYDGSLLPDGAQARVDPTCGDLRALLTLARQATDADRDSLATPTGGGGIGSLPTLATEQVSDDAVVELVRLIRDDDHKRLCEGRQYTCTCGYDDDVQAAVAKLERGR